MEPTETGERYSRIVSLWAQEPVLRKLCRSLNDGGVLLTSIGGVEEPGEIRGSFDGETFEYSSLGIRRNCEILDEEELLLSHLEFDQGPQEKHDSLIAQKKSKQASGKGLESDGF